MAGVTMADHCALRPDVLLCAMHDFINRIWYPASSFSPALLAAGLLLPFSGLFYLASATRRHAYRAGWLSSSAPDVPVVVVGGITAGGSGKTPLCISLVRHFQRRGLRVGVLSRGYRASGGTFPRLVGPGCDARSGGDEPCLIYRRTGAVVVIDPNRRRGADFLRRQGVNVIVCDDGLQHYALQRDFEIVVVDSRRQFGNRLLLPAGPLREGLWRLDQAGCIVENGALQHNNYYCMRLQPSTPHRFNDESVSLTPGTQVCALAGIADPQRFRDTLAALDFEVSATLAVGDHDWVSLEAIREQARSLPVVMTEKDAVKYAGSELENVYVLRVEAVLPPEFYELLTEQFVAAIPRAQARARPAAAEAP